MSNIQTFLRSSKILHRKSGHSSAQNTMVIVCIVILALDAVHGGANCLMDGRRHIRVLQLRTIPGNFGKKCCLSAT